MKALSMPASITFSTSYLSMPLRPQLTKDIFKPIRVQEKKRKVPEQTKLEIGLLVKQMNIEES